MGHGGIEGCTLFDVDLELSLTLARVQLLLLEAGHKMILQVAGSERSKAKRSGVMSPSVVTGVCGACDTDDGVRELDCGQLQRALDVGEGTQDDDLKLLHFT